TSAGGAGAGAWAPTSVAGIARQTIKRPTAISSVLPLCRCGTTYSSIRISGKRGSAASRGQALSVGADLAQDALQARLARGIHVNHRPGDRGVDSRDALVHGLGDSAVGRVSLAARAKLDHVHGLPRVEIEDIADPVAEAESVGRRLGKPLRLEPLELPPRDLQGPLVFRPGARIAHLLRDRRAQMRPQALPLAGQHPMALQIAKATVVGDDLEPVAHRLPAAARAVATVSPLTCQLGDQLGALQR